MKKNLLPTLFVLSFFALSAIACGRTDSPSSSAASVESVPSSSSKESVHEHDYQHHDAIPASCTETGKAAYYSCSGCDKIFTESKEETTADALVVAALGHNTTRHDAVPGTDCQHKGTIEYYSCDRCDGKFSDAAGEHVLESIEGEVGAHSYIHHDASDPTCVATGMMEYYSCSNCSEVFDKDMNPTTMEALVVAALGHDAEHHDAVSGTDCQHKGTVEYYSCSRCELLFSDATCETIIDSTEGVVGSHTYVSHEAKASSCSEHGNLAYYTCEVCDGIFDADYNPTTLEALTLPLELHDLHYSHNEEGHWQECGNCSYASEVSAHSYSEYVKGNAIGSMQSSCDCGATRSRLVTTDDFVLGEDLFGSSITTDSTGSKWVGRANEKQAYTFGRDGGSAETFSLNLPLVEFKNYSSVKFSFIVASGWFNLGPDSSHTVRVNGDGATGYFKTQRLSTGEVDVTFSFDNNSNYPGTPLVHNYVLEDQDILDGLKPLSIYAHNVNNADRCIYVSNIELEETCAHNFAFIADEEIIGTSHSSACTKCGEASSESSSRVSQGEDVIYSYSTHGAKLYRVNDGSYYGGEYLVENSVTGTDTALSYKPDGDYVAFRAEMPKIDFSHYASATFPLSVGDAHYGMSLTGSVWNEDSGIRGKDFTASLLIEKTGESTLHVSLTKGTLVIERTIEGESATSIINGSCGVPVFFSVSSTAAFAVGAPVLVAA